MSKANSQSRHHLWPNHSSQLSLTKIIKTHSIIIKAINQGFPFDQPKCPLKMKENHQKGHQEKHREKICKGCNFSTNHYQKNQSQTQTQKP